MLIPLSRGYNVRKSQSRPEKPFHPAEAGDGGKHHRVPVLKTHSRQTERPKKHLERFPECSPGNFFFFANAATAEACVDRDNRVPKRRSYSGGPLSSTKDRKGSKKHSKSKKKETTTTTRSDSTSSVPSKKKGKGGSQKSKRESSNDDEDCESFYDWDLQDCGKVGQGEGGSMWKKSKKNKVPKKSTKKKNAGSNNKETSSKATSKKLPKKSTKKKNDSSKNKEKSSNAVPVPSLLQPTFSPVALEKDVPITVPPMGGPTVSPMSREIEIPTVSPRAMGTQLPSPAITTVTPSTMIREPTVPPTTSAPFTDASPMASLTVSPTNAPATTVAPVPASPFPLKIKRDSFGLANEFATILQPYIPVELVDGADEFNLAFDLTEGTGLSASLPSNPMAFCEAGGYTITAEINSSDPGSLDNLVANFLPIVMRDWGIQKQPEACDAGYYFHSVPEISCCTAQQLSALDLCFKGRQEAMPPCWRPVYTTPETGTPLVRVKVLLSPDLTDWTEADTLRKLERANRLVATSVGLTNQVRFVLFAQETLGSDLHTAVSVDGATLDRTRDFGAGDADRDQYDVIMYLFGARSEAGVSVTVGKAESYLCSTNPSAVVANVKANLVIPHELVHTLGAIHVPGECTDYIIDIDLGMGACNVDLMQARIPTYTCLDRAE